jgi:hypothetical protein
VPDVNRDAIVGMQGDVEAVVDDNAAVAVLDHGLVVVAECRRAGGERDAELCGEIAQAYQVSRGRVREDVLRLGGAVGHKPPARRGPVDRSAAGGAKDAAD